MEMDEDFHLSIKNNLRKIKDVRDLFKDLTQKEMNTLEIEKKKSEMSALIKKTLQNNTFIQRVNHHNYQNLAKVEKKEMFILKESHLIKTSQDFNLQVSSNNDNQILVNKPPIQHQPSKRSIVKNNRDQIVIKNLNTSSQPVRPQKQDLNNEKYFYYFQNDLDNNSNKVGVGITNSSSIDDLYENFMKKNIVKNNQQGLIKKKSYNLKIEDTNMNMDMEQQAKNVLNTNCNNALKTKLRNCLETELGIHSKIESNLKCKLANKLSPNNNINNSKNQLRSSHLNLLLDNLINNNSYQDYNTSNNGYELSKFENWDYLLTKITSNGQQNSSKTVSSTSTGSSAHTTSSIKQSKIENYVNQQNNQNNFALKEKLIATKDLNLKTIVNSRLSNVTNGQLGQYFYDHKTNGFKYLPTASGGSNHSSQSSGSNNSINNINNRSNNLNFNQMPSLDKLMMKGNRSNNIKVQPFRF